MMRRSHFIFGVLLIGLAAVLIAPQVAQACPTCKEGLASNDPEHAGMVKGYFYSILLMMSMPYILMSGFGLYMYQLVKKARKQKEAQTASLAADGASQRTAPSQRAPADAAELLEV
jgi:uncharacterized membrane protein